jgi:hypothetical protein
VNLSGAVVNFSSPDVVSLVWFGLMTMSICKCSRIQLVRVLDVLRVLAPKFVCLTLQKCSAQPGQQNMSTKLEKKRRLVGASGFIAYSDI